MRNSVSKAFRAAFLLFLTIAAAAPVSAADGVRALFEAEEIRPYVKIMKGPWASNIITGEDGNYAITSLMPPESEFVIGLFDHKVSRKGQDERSAVVLVDGVNPLEPKERVEIEEANFADVSGFKKIPLNALSFNAKDGDGTQSSVVIVDSKKEFEFGDVKPFKLAERSGRILGRVHVIVFAGPALPPKPGQIVKYGKPLDRFAFTLQRQDAE